MQVQIHDMSGPRNGISDILLHGSSRQFIDNFNIHNTGKIFEFDDLNESSQNFYRTVVEPSIRSSSRLKSMYGDLLKLDVYRPLRTIEDFYNVPPVMRESILSYPIVRKLAEQDRIDGWDIPVENIPDDDFYGRMCSNFLMEDIGSAKDGFVDYQFTITSNDEDLDPDYEENERRLDAIRITREYVEDLIRQSIDPTNPDNNIG